MSRHFSSTGLRWLWIAVVVLFIDLSSKYLLLQNFYLFEEEPLLPFLSLYYVQNHGMAFSLLSGSGAWRHCFFSAITVGICMVLIFLMYRFDAVNKKIINISYALILGGALSNLFDRWWHGFVVDMIDFFIGNWHFAIFNLADVAICSGALLATLEKFFYNPRQ